MKKNYTTHQRLTPHNKQQGQADHPCAMYSLRSLVKQPKPIYKCNPYILSTANLRNLFNDLAYEISKTDPQPSGSLHLLLKFDIKSFTRVE